MVAKQPPTIQIHDYARMVTPIGAILLAVTGDMTKSPGHRGCPVCVCVCVCVCVSLESLPVKAVA